MEYFRLSDCADYASDRTSNITVENYISTENMIPNKGGVTTASSIPDAKTASAYKENDILLSNIRPYFCKIWLADKEGSCSNDVLVIRAKKDINSKFLYYVLSDKNFFNWDNVTSKGTKMPRGTPKAIMKYFVPNVDNNIQQKIANILSRYDEAIENNNKRIKLLEQMAQNLYKEWFVRFRFPGWENTEFENGIPKGWKVEKLGKLLERQPFGKTYKKEDLEKEGNVIVIDQSTDDFLGFHNNEPAYKADFSNPMILFGDHSCKFVLMCRNFSLGENIIPINAKNCNSYYLFRSIDGIIETTEYKRHWSMLINQKILLPSRDLQDKFGSVYKSFIKQIENLKQKNQNLTKQRDLLLPRLMSGKIEVN